MNAALTAAESARDAAMIMQNVASLEQVLSDDLVWIHSSGKVENKAAFLARIAEGQDRYLEIRSSEIAVRQYGEVAIVTGVREMAVLVGGASKCVRNRFTNIWRADGAQLRLVSCQSTKLI